MKTDKFGQIIYDADEVFDILMHDINPTNPNYTPGPFMLANNEDVVAINQAAGYEALVAHLEDDSITIDEFDKQNQADWWMPDSYKEMDIAEHILSLCDLESELQRCGDELLLYMERDLFDLLRYMKYLVDTMELNNVVWGVGRGSSVSSYVLFKLKVHRIDSMFYQLDPKEFLR